MQENFLKDLGLDSEVIDKILAENTADCEKITSDLTPRIAGLEGQLTTAKDTLKSFEGVDVLELQGKIKQLSGDLATKESGYQKELEGMKFQSLLSSAITSSGVKNEKAVMGFLDLESLKSSKNQTEDIKKALDGVKAENDYLFSSDEPVKNPVKDTGSPNLGGSNDTMRAIMGLPPSA